jgi:hypothetical protein
MRPYESVHYADRRIRNTPSPSPAWRRRTEQARKRLSGLGGAFPTISLTVRVTRGEGLPLVRLTPYL